jgi:ribosome recycling factor
LGKEYSQLNIGRASPMVLDGVTVESYGGRVPLKNLASISIEDPKTLRVAPWDKNQIKDIYFFLKQIMNIFKQIKDMG